MATAANVIANVIDLVFIERSNVLSTGDNLILVNLRTLIWRRAKKQSSLPIGDCMNGKVQCSNI